MSFNDNIENFEIESDVQLGSWYFTEGFKLGLARYKLIPDYKDVNEKIRRRY